MESVVASDQPTSVGNHLCRSCWKHWWRRQVSVRLVHAGYPCLVATTTPWQGVSQFPSMTKSTVKLLRWRILPQVPVVVAQMSRWQLPQCPRVMPTADTKFNLVGSQFPNEREYQLQMVFLRIVDGGDQRRGGGRWRSSQMSGHPRG